MKTSLSKLLLFCLISLLLVGCWDYTEIEFLEFVLGAGVDAVEPKMILITELAGPVGSIEAAEFNPVVLTTESRGLVSGSHAISNPAGIKISWPHTQVFLVSEEVARGGMAPVLEPILRAQALRGSMFLFVTKDCTVEEVFKSKPPLTEGVSQHISNIIHLRDSSSSSNAQSVWQFTDDLAEIGISGTLPVIQLVHEGGNLVPIIEGTAVFKGDRQVGWLDKEETQIFTLLKNINQKSMFTMDTKFYEETFTVTYEFRSDQVQIKPTVDNGELIIEISLELQVGVVETGAVEINPEESLVKDVERQLSHAFYNRIEEFLFLIQKEFRSDILGFGQIVMRKKPQIWRQLGEDWEQIYSNLAVKTEVKSRITFTGLRSDAMRVKY